MFLRKHWIVLTVFLLAIVGASLYYLQTRPPKEPITIIKPTEVEKPPAETSPDAQQGGHFHTDGTWHKGPHEEHAPAKGTTPEVQVAPGGAQGSEPMPPVSEDGIAAGIPTESKPLSPITLEEYKQQFVEWENAPRDEWGIAQTADGGVKLFPKPPGQAGIWQTREEKEKASDLWWAAYEKKVAASRETRKLLNERARQLGGK